MNKSLVITSPLPEFLEPSSLDEARESIITLGITMHEHAYLVGKHLNWVKAKVGHGNFLDWLERNIWFGERTARRFMDFTGRCDAKSTLLEYHPRKSDTVSDLNPPTGQSQVIYADPPWDYSNAGFDQSAEQQYPTIPTIQLCTPEEWLILWKS